MCAYSYSNKLAIVFFIFFIPLVLFAAEPENFNDARETKEKTLSLNFQDIKIRAVLQILAEFSGFNLVVDDKVQGNLSLHLNEIPWEQALEVILQARGLAKRPIANGWMITTQQEFLQQDKKNKEIQHQRQDFAELISKLIEIRYSNAMELATLLKSKNNTFLSSRGSISVDKRTNSLWIQDSKEKLIKIEKVIKALDKRIAQVSIEARIVSIDKNKERELGARFKLMPAQTASNKSSRTFPDANRSNTLLPHLNMDLPLSVGDSVADGIEVGLHLLRMGKNVFLDLELSALESEGGAQIISAPHLITEDQKTAFIEAGQEIPYQARDISGNTSLVFKEAVLALTVTPRVLPDRRLMLDLKLNQNQPSNFMVSGAPAIQKRGITTQVIVKNGETIVLGGIYEHSQSQRVRSIPFLSSLPLIGNLFRYKETSDEHNELLIFVTPTILPA